MIPAKLHTIWLGGGERGSSWEICKASMERLKGSLEWVEWNEERIEREGLVEEKHRRFYERSLEKKRYSAASDLIRHLVLHRYGGIYLDVDTEVVKPLEEWIREFDEKGWELVVGMESKDYAAVGSIAAVAGQEVIGRMLEKFEGKEEEVVCRSFLGKETRSGRIDGDELVGITGPILFTHVVQEFLPSPKIAILPVECFYPLPPGSKIENKKRYRMDAGRAYSIHWWEASWVTKAPVGSIKEEAQRPKLERFSLERMINRSLMGFKGDQSL